MTNLFTFKVSRLRDTESSAFHARVAEKIGGFNFPTLQPDIAAYIAEADKLRDDIRQERQAPAQDRQRRLRRPHDPRRHHPHRHRHRHRHHQQSENRDTRFHQ